MHVYLDINAYIAILIHTGIFLSKVKCIYRFYYDNKNIFRSCIDVE